MKIDKNLKGIALQAVGITGGSIAANYLGKAVDKMSFIPESVKPYAAPLANVAGGILVATKLSKKQPMLQSVGVGMAAKGIQQLIGSLVPSLGIGSITYDPTGFIGNTDAVYSVEVPVSPYNKASVSLAGYDTNGGTFANL